jgi:hypothetical protein
MKNLQEYIEESLLDDIDDLETNSDKIVKSHVSLYGHYDLHYIKMVSAPKLNKCIDKKAINKLDAELNLDKHYRVNSSVGTASKLPVAKYISMLADYIMKLHIYDEFKMALKEKQKEKQADSDSYYEYTDVSKYMPELFKKLSQIFVEDFQILLWREDHMMIHFSSDTHFVITLLKR